MSILHSNTIQSTSDPTEQETEHVPIIKKISSSEILIDFSKFKRTKDHYVEMICLYNSNKQLVDAIYLRENHDASMIVFDLSKINKRESLINYDRDFEFIPRHWDINEDFHVVLKCSIHGNWSDVPEEEL